MSNTNTGGPAFPGRQKALSIKAEHVHIAHEYEIEFNGMTLRDYFAAKAMLFYYSGSDAKVISKHPDAIARWCYLMADEMLKAREQ